MDPPGDLAAGCDFGRPLGRFLTGAALMRGLMARCLLILSTSSSKGKECRVRNVTLRQQIAEARRIAETTVRPDDRNSIERRAADAIRLARMATAVHMVEAVRSGVSPSLPAAAPASSRRVGESIE